MQPAPSQIGELPVLAFTAIDWRHRPTGNCHHTVGGADLDGVAGLAICRARPDAGYYLFYCGADWQPLTDTWHASHEDAMHQAEFEYEGVTGTWEM